MDISGGAEAMLAALRGSWQVARVLRHGDGRWARFSGRAEWVPEAGGLRCVEAGEMVLDEGTRFAATRETLWHAAADRVEVAFGDGRPFHGFHPASQAQASHDCAPDTYRLTYDFRATGFWSCRWRVTGPRKDYHALTRHWRSG